MLILVGLLLALYVPSGGSRSAFEAARRRARTDRHGQELARARARRTLRRRDHQLRFDGGLSRFRYRYRQGAGRGASRDPASPDRHRRPHRRLHRRAVCSRRGGCGRRDARAGKAYRSWSAAPASTTARSHEGCFPDLARMRRCARRLDAIAERRGVEFLWRMVKRVDPASAGAHSPARSQAARARVGGLLPDRQAADRSLRKHALTAAGRRAGRRRSPSDCRRRSLPNGSRAGSTRSSAAGIVDEVKALVAAGRAGTGATVRRARLSPGARVSARYSRRSGDARTDRARESTLRATPVDLVP